MKTKSKALLLSLCAVMLVCASVMGTLAWLSDKTDDVVNTFTVGNVQIDLNEVKVLDDGTIDSTATERVKENTYQLIPSHTYTKDPTVQFQPKSEASYLFVKVVNGLNNGTNNIEAAQSDTYDTVAEQIKKNGWTALTGVENVYYKTVDENGTDAAIPYVVFEKFQITGTVDNDTLATFNQDTIVVTAYAIQQDGLDDANAAWTAGGWT